MAALPVSRDQGAHHADLKKNLEMEGDGWFRERERGGFSSTCSTRRLATPSARSASRARTGTARGRCSAMRSRSRRPGPSRSCSSSSRSSWPRPSPSGCGSRRSVSARAPGARGRSRSSPTRSGWATGRRSTPAVRGPARDDPARREPIPSRRRGGDLPGRTQTVLMDAGVLDEVLGRSVPDRPSRRRPGAVGIPLDRDL